MKDIFESISELKKAGKVLAIAIVIRAEGSTPRKPGAKMIVCSDGETFGTLGEGDLETRSFRRPLEDPDILGLVLTIYK